MRTPAIILSAGESKRLGFPKSELKIGKKTLLEDQIDRLNNGGCYDIVVVAGAYPAESLSAKAHKKNVSFAMNEHWRLGQFSSIKCGLTILKKKENGCLILPVDVPFVPSALIKRMISKANKNRVEAVIPIFCDGDQGRKSGHPIWISKHLINKALKTDVKTGRLDKILQQADSVLFLKTRSRSILNNVNTISDWKKINLF